MRVLFVTHSFPRQGGDAAGSFILRLARALGDIGIEVRVIAPSDAGLSRDDIIDGVPVRRFRYAPVEWETLAYRGTMAEQVSGSIRGKLALAGLVGGGTRAVWREVAEWAPDCIHAHWWFPSGLLAAAARSGRTPLVTTMHGSDVRLARKSSWGPWLFQRVMNRSAAVTAVSSSLAEQARAFLPSLEVTVAPMPVEHMLFTPTGALREPGRLLFVGRLNQQKGIGDLLDAMSASRSPVTLDVVGDGPERAQFEQRASSLGLSARVTWRGQLSQRDLVPLYRAATAVVIPSVDEGLGLVAVEALLCESPVIAYRSGGLTDIVRDGETGVLVAPGDPRALAAAIDALVANPAPAQALAQKGRSSVLDRFSPTAAARAYQKIYRQAVGA